MKYNMQNGSKGYFLPQCSFSLSLLNSKFLWTIKWKLYQSVVYVSSLSNWRYSGAAASASYLLLFCFSAQCVSLYVEVHVLVHVIQPVWWVSVWMYGCALWWFNAFWLFVTHQSVYLEHRFLSVIHLYVSRVTEDPRGLVVAMDPKEGRWDWDWQKNGRL